MNLIESIIIGIIQGVTEFLPISSSGHIYLAEQFFGLVSKNNFTIWLHFASLLAVMIYFRQDIYQMAKGMLIVFFKTTDREIQKQKILGWQLVIATFITAPIAIKLDDYVARIISVKIIAVTLIFTGFLVFISDKFSPKKFRKFSWPLTVALGIVQGFSVVKGISRSGLTIAFLILIGIERRESAKISFLLSIPTILGALIFDFKDTGWEISISFIHMVGCMVCFVVALLTIKYMMKWIKKYWIWFAPYCILVGTGLLFVI